MEQSSRAVEGPLDATVVPLVERLWAEADLCRNEGATDIADLLDETVRELQSLEVQAFAGQAGQWHLGALVDELRAEIAAALPAMRQYARENPRHEYSGVEQDPCGVHAWLARNEERHNAELSRARDGA